MPDTASMSATAMRLMDTAASDFNAPAPINTVSPVSALTVMAVGDGLHKSFSVGTINTVKITFDPFKQAANLESRGLSFELARELDWVSAVIIEDTRRDYGERRFCVFGYVGERLYALVFTPRGDAVHVISFRKANGREINRYG
jgi:hypothetical protein